ncbi:hypothetical protein HCN44_005897 [Aphidius gifuensis]|uniref:Transcription factor CBF/NF-Y/archaeal histone domain-containing protein n=1 Tax=Aphidius gifuensis TaxID=684658 RepID=A0A834XUQ6_APHGI|nr:hypothetical protein HCN44_005897 [Aphidius gifuensis]
MQDFQQTLELFVESLLLKTSMITNSKGAKTLSPSHMKQCILSESRFDFLKDLVKGIPDVSGNDDEVPTPPMTPAPSATGAYIKQEIGVPLDFSRKTMQMNAANASIKMEPIDPSLPSPLRVPNFQISMPSSFEDVKPNFYTELNETTAVNINQPTSNFGHTADIDEDYDT